MPSHSWRGTMRAELFDRRAIRQLGQNAAVHQRRGEVVCDRLLTGQIGGTLSGNNGRQLFVRKAAVFRDDHMGVEFVGRFKVRAGDEDGNFSDVGRKRRVGDHRLGQLPHRLAKLGLVDPRIPGTQQRAVVANVDKALEIPGDAVAHIVIERLLFGIQFSGSNDGQTHISNSGCGLSGWFVSGITMANKLKVTFRRRSGGLTFGSRKAQSNRSRNGWSKTTAPYSAATVLA